MDTTNRLLSLDAYRGLTIAAMILVNNPGSWDSVYTPLMHAEWHGATPTDWIFPFFLFIVGVSIALAIGKLKEERVDRKTLLRKIWRRSLIIFAIGLFLAAFPYFDLATLRVPGVLQRIALVYGVTATLYVWLNPRQMLFVGVGCLLAYWGLMTLVPVPGGYAPNLEPSTNLGAWLDRLLLDGHLWSHSRTWDPEGLLGTIPAVGTGISGILTGAWLRTDKNHYEKVAGLMVVGAALLALGLTWDMVFPINKQIWTSSYVVYTSGIAMLLLGVVYWWIEVKGHHWGSRPFIILGMNAIVVYTLSGILARLMLAIKWTGGDGHVVTVKGWLWQSVFQPAFASTYDASLIFAISHVLFLLGIAWILYVRKVFIKI